MPMLWDWRKSSWALKRRRRDHLMWFVQLMRVRSGSSSGADRRYGWTGRNSPNSQRSRAPVRFVMLGAAWRRRGPPGHGCLSRYAEHALTARSLVVSPRRRAIGWHPFDDFLAVPAGALMTAWILSRGHRWNVVTS